jgi:hypothetical protein
MLIKNFPLCIRKCRLTQPGVTVLDRLEMLVILSSITFLQDLNAGKLFHFERDIICLQQTKKKGLRLKYGLYYHLKKGLKDSNKVLIFCEP